MRVVDAHDTGESRTIDWVVCPISLFLGVSELLTTLEEYFLSHQFNDQQISFTPTEEGA